MVNIPQTGTLSADKGQMKVNEEPISQEHLPVLPNDEENKECTVGADDKVCGKGGDVRAAEQPGLTGIHTILVREHNRIALELSDINGHWDEDRLYHEARKIVNALYQHIIYNEFLPIILGHELMDFSELTVGSDSSYAGYRETVSILDKELHANHHVCSYQGRSVLRDNM